MTFSQLTYFKEVCDQGGINKAAQSLHVTPPTVSIAIRNLEQECGMQLFLRTGSKMVLTAEGQLFYGEVAGLLQDFTRISEFARDLAKTPHTIRYGSVPLAGSYLTPIILHNFYTLYPGESISSIERTPEELIEMVLSGDLDVILIPDGERLDEYQPYLDKISYTVVKEERFDFATYPQHPLAGRSSISVQDILEEPLVMLQSNYSQNALVNNLYNELGRKPNVIFRTSQLKTIERFVNKGISSAFMYKGLIEECPGLVNIRVEEITKVIRLVLIWRKGAYQFSSVKLFIRAVEELSRYL